MGWINSSAFLSVLDLSLFLSSKNADEFLKVQGHCVIWKQIWLLYDLCKSWLTKYAKCKFCSSLFHALEGTSGTFWKNNKNMNDLNWYIITGSAWSTKEFTYKKKNSWFWQNLKYFLCYEKKKKDILKFPVKWKNRIETKIQTT